MSFANIAFPIAVNRLFTYSVPKYLDAIVQPGVRVLAPFHGDKLEGVVVERVNETDLAPDKIKNITDCLDEEPTYSEELLELTKWMADYYLSSWGNALFCAVPAAVRNQKQQLIQLRPEYTAPTGKVQKQIVTLLETEGALSPYQLARRIGASSTSLRPKITALREKGVIDIKVTHKPKATAQFTNVATLDLPHADIEAEIAELTSGDDGYGNSTNQNTRRVPHAAAVKHAEILQILLDEDVPVATSELTKQVRASNSLLRTLERRGFIKITRAAAVRNPLSSQPVAPTQPLTLNEAQAAAFTELQSENHSNKTFLLHGVTGSGKTEVYMQVMAQILENGKSVIVLVPEISLTPQTASRFIGRFGERVAVLHSRLSAGERFDQWHRIQKGDADIVIGPRSAVFAPVKKLGLLIIDEEHSDSYKSDTAPRYHAREVAQKRTELANCPLILGSATPSLESFFHAKKGNYKLLSLPSRVLDRKMPEVHIVDMRNELKNGNRTIFSEHLRSAIAERLQKREQIILFLNRRGHSKYVFCRTCGYAERCENCSISLTFHFETKKLVCHHCGHKRETHPSCPDCGSPAIDYFGRRGFGTETVEREVQKAFPTANIKRFDADSTAKKNAHQHILEDFQNQKIDILIGTQMVAKGLDFPNVTLVGVIVADTALNLPDFRASEQTFSLLTQVAGRSGRAEVAGEVIIQTYMPDHYCISAAQTHDYIGFYEKEVDARSGLQYPPFSHVATLLLRGKNENEVIDAANTMGGRLQIWQTDAFPEVKILGPAPAPLSKIDGKFRWRFLLRSKNVEKISQLLQRLNDDLPPAIKSNAIECVIDIDPTNTL
ncbi:MAG: primosomal protein N' [Candidatus Poribacteria bacterium]|nr:primosomal protein N' [Candidatus Poribacteria bacterium]